MGNIREAWALKSQSGSLTDSNLREFAKGAGNEAIQRFIREFELCVSPDWTPVDRARNLKLAAHYFGNFVGLLSGEPVAQLVDDRMMIGKLKGK